MLNDMQSRLHPEFYAALKKILLFSEMFSAWAND